VLIDEYELARTRRILRPRFCGIHCTALGEPQFDEWERIAEDIDAAEDVEGEENGTIVWSPFSNLWLYRATTAVVAARDRGMRVCLGSDWSPSGSKNLLGELKVADMWNRTHLGGEFSAEELCAMATRNPADALGWSARIGRLKEGLHGDLLVTNDRGGSAYRNLIESVERDVELVAINGQPFYGRSKLMNASGATHDEPIRLGRLRRRIRLVYPGIKDADMGWADALADIDEAKRDPVARYLEIEHLHEVGDPPPWLRTDKPWDDPAVTGKPVPVTVRIPPLDSLVHDAAYFRAVERAPLHGGLLDPFGPTISRADGRRPRPGSSTMIEFDRGPPKPLAQHLANAPGYTAAERQLFWYDWGPVFYRGRVGGSARLLGIASDPGPTERVACRTLVGDAGQRVQGFLSGARLDPLVRARQRASLRPCTPARPTGRNRCSPKRAHRDWRNGFYDAIVEPKLQAVVAFGDQAREAVCLWSPPNGVEPFEVPHPSSHNENCPAERVARRHRRPRGNRHAGQRRLRVGPELRQQLRGVGQRTHPARRPALRAGGVVRRRRLGSPGHAPPQELRRAAEPRFEHTLV
jgi:hypothetical protein